MTLNVASAFVGGRPLFWIVWAVLPFHTLDFLQQPAEVCLAVCISEAEGSGRHRQTKKLLPGKEIRILEEIRARMRAR